MLSTTQLWPATRAQMSERCTWISTQSELEALAPTEVGLLALPFPVPHVWWLNELKAVLGLSWIDLEILLYDDGPLEFHHRATNIELTQRLDELSLAPETNRVWMRVIRRLLDAGVAPTALFLDALPIAPAELRGPADPDQSAPSEIYKNVIAAVQQHDRQRRLSASPLVIEHARVELVERVFDALTMGLVRMGIAAGFTQGRDELLIPKLGAVIRAAGAETPPRHAPQNTEIWFGRMSDTLSYFAKVVDAARDERALQLRKQLLTCAALHE